MLKETFSLIKRDKRKWLFFLGSYFLFMAVYAGAIWLAGQATYKLIQTIGAGNAYALFMGFIRCFGAIPLVLLGLFIYWAHEIKPGKKNIHPWLFWSILLVLSTAIGFIGNDIIGERIIRAAIQTHNLAQAAFWRSAIYIGTGLLGMVVFLLLWPCMLAIWEQRSVWGGYKIALLDWKKDLGWLGLLTVVLVVKHGLYCGIKKISLPTPIEACIYQLISLYGHAVVIYFMAVWMAKKPYVSEAAKKQTSTIDPVLNMERIHAFFEVVKQNNEPGVQQMLQETPLLVHAVSSDGDTALHIAARNGWTGLAETFLKIDQEIRAVQNEAGKTPFDLAREQGFDELAQLLK